MDELNKALHFGLFQWEYDSPFNFFSEEERFLSAVIYPNVTKNSKTLYYHEPDFIPPLFLTLYRIGFENLSLISFSDRFKDIVSTLLDDKIKLLDLDSLESESFDFIVLDVYALTDKFIKFIKKLLDKKGKIALLSKIPLNLALLNKAFKGYNINIYNEKAIFISKTPIKKLLNPYLDDSLKKEFIVGRATSYPYEIFPYYKENDRENVLVFAPYNYRISYSEALNKIGYNPFVFIKGNFSKENYKGLKKDLKKLNINKVLVLYPYDAEFFKDLELDIYLYYIDPPLRFKGFWKEEYKKFFNQSNVKVFSPDKNHIQFLKFEGIKAHYLPLGGDNFNFYPLNLEKTIDVGIVSGADIHTDKDLSLLEKEAMDSYFKDFSKNIIYHIYKALGKDYTDKWFYDEDVKELWWNIENLSYIYRNELNKVLYEEFGAEIYGQLYISSNNYYSFLENLYVNNKIILPKFSIPYKLVNIFLNKTKIHPVFHKVNNISSLGLRFFETALSKSFPLIDYKEEAKELFPDLYKDFCAFSLDDFVKKIDYFLVYENERESIGAALRKNVLEKHTIANRLEEVFKL